MHPSPFSIYYKAEQRRSEEKEYEGRYGEKGRSAFINMDIVEYFLPGIVACEGIFLVATEFIRIEGFGIEFG